MIIKGTRCRVMDNSGALEVEVFGFYKQPLTNKPGFLSKRGSKHAVVGDLVKVAVKKAEPNNPKNIKKGSVSKAILCQSVRKERKAADGCHIKFFSNSVVLVDNQNKPIGTRVKGFISSKVTIKEIVNMSKGAL